MQHVRAVCLVSCLVCAGRAFGQEGEAFESRARAAWERGQVAEALTAFHKAVASRNPDDITLPDLLDEVAEVECRAGNFSEAERSAARALTIRRRMLGPEHPSVATSMNNLGEVLFAEGEYKEAEQYYRHAVELVKHQAAPDAERQAKFLGNLGKALTARHSYREAGQVLGRALEQWTKSGNLFEQAVTLGNLALLAGQCGQYAEAEQMYRRALERLDAKHPNAIAARSNLADVLRIRKRYEESEREFNQALPLLEETLGPEHPDRAAALTLYANLLRDTHRTGEANRLSAEAKRIRELHARTDGGAWVVDARVHPPVARTRPIR